MPRGGDNFGRYPLKSYRFHCNLIFHDIHADMYTVVEYMTLDKLPAWFNENVGGRGVSILVLGKRSEIDLDALAGFGEVKEMDVKYLFNH